ncbi:MAG: efflux RND transporter permease subunit [Azospirillaceae bacterium]|nr:efflux RND transporter permease subunit [Azospirillaceae bacterium]
MNGFNLSAWALQHRSFVVYLMLLCAVAGVGSYLTLGRGEDPPFTIKTMVVKTLWPGATVDETIKQVTDRIEKKLEETPELDHLQSYTEAGVSVVFVVIKESAPAAAMPEIWYQVRKKTADIQQNLPSGVQGPFFDDEFGDTFGIIYGFSADGFNNRELRDYVESVRDALLQLPDIGKISLIGVQDEKIDIDFSTRKLASLGISQDELMQSLKAQNAVTATGVIETPDERILLRVSGGFHSEADLAAINLRANGRFYRLSDIAEIHHGFSDPPAPLFRVNGKPAIGLAISMATGGNVLTLGDNIRRRMAELEKDRPVGIDATVVADQPEVVRASVHGFVKSLDEAVFIVLVVSFLSLGLRAGMVVAFSIPLVLAMTFVGMHLFGIDLQRVSLGALIIALGLLVDDAMITVEMMVRKLEEGFSLLKAATFAYTSTAFPMLTGTLVTVIGFVPVAFAKSSSGEYCASLFSVMTLALLISWVVAVVFAPLIGLVLLKPRTPSGVAAHGAAASPRNWVFQRVLTVSLRHRAAVIVATLGLFVVSLFGATRLEQQFFPASERPEILVNLTLPQSASIAATQRAVAALEKHLAGDRDVARYSVDVGEGAVRFYLPLDVQLAHDYFAQAVVVARNSEVRDALAARLRQAIMTELPDATVQVSPMELGPPVGWPIKFRVSGPDTQRVRSLAYAVADIVAGDPRTWGVNFDWNEPIKTVRLRVQQDKARLLGLTSQALATAIHTAFTGNTITQVRDGIYLIDVQTRARDAERQDIETLRQLQIVVGGQNIPLDAVATLEYGFEQPIVWRRQRLPTITVQADVAAGARAETEMQRLQPAIDTLAATLPSGYAIAVGGAVEEAAKGQASVTAVFPLMLVLMLTVLMIQLQSFQRLLLVVSVAPLGLIGVVAAMLPMHQPMGFVAMLGCIALIGMIIRNAVILIDQIEHNVAAGQNRYDAVIDATGHRLRPILLTASAAILGMVPIAGESFWGPMAYAIMGGLVVATLLTLVFLPAAYLAWFRVPIPR